MLLESLTPFICESHLLSGERPHTQSLISPPAFSYTNAAKATSGHTVLDLVYVLVLALFLSQCSNEHQSNLVSRASDVSCVLFHCQAGE